MEHKKGILILGPGASGKTTLGEELSKILKYDFIDIDAFVWRKDTPRPWMTMFSPNEKIKILKTAISKCNNYVMSGTMVDIHKEFDNDFKYVIFLDCDVTTCLNRADNRALKNMGPGIRVPGEQYEIHQRFLKNLLNYDEDGNPNRKEHELWLKNLQKSGCKIIKLDGTKSIKCNCDEVLKLIKK